MGNNNKQQYECSSRVSHLWFVFLKFLLKSQIFQFFASNPKKSHQAGSKSTRIKDRLDSYLQRVKSLLGMGQGPPLLKTLIKTLLIILFERVKRASGEVRIFLCIFLHTYRVGGIRVQHGENVVCLSVTLSSSLSFKPRALKFCKETPLVKVQKVTEEFSKFCFMELCYWGFSRLDIFAMIM